MRTTLRTILARICMLHILMFSLVAPLQAGMISADQLQQPEQVQSDRDRVNSWMQREDVKAQFAELGVAPKEIESRIAALSDAEVAELAQRMDDQPAGGLLAVIGVVFVVLLVLELVGVTDIFKNVGPVN